MKAFGSEIDLQPYCSLRNLYEMRRRDMDKQKNRRVCDFLLPMMYMAHSKAGYSEAQTSVEMQI